MDNRRIEDLVHEALCDFGDPTRVLVVGLSLTGHAVASVLLRAGIPVLVVEEYPDRSKLGIAEELRDLAASVGGRAALDLHLGPIDRMDLSMLEGTALAIPSPGVSKKSRAIELCEERCASVWSEIELAFRILQAARRSGSECGLVAVTGTNGKTTTVRLIEHMLGRMGLRALGCGNIGYPFIRAVLDGSSAKTLVAEVSSFQLAFCDRFRPDVSVFLNFAPDHLDWHPSLADYAESKSKIFRQQKSGDSAVYNFDDEAVRCISESALDPGVNRIPFSTSAVNVGSGALVIDDEVVRLPDGSSFSIPRAGESSNPSVPMSNLAAAIGVALASALDIERATATFGEFAPPPHRLEVVAEVEGRVFVDDSKATNPHAVGAALGSYDSIVLIAGGRNKGIDLSEFADQMAASKAVKRVVCIGESSKELAELLRRRRIDVEEAVSMEAAVDTAWNASRPGDVILLSPGCASFDWYANYEERGSDFARLVRALASRRA